MSNITISEALSYFISEELNSSTRVRDMRELHHLITTGNFPVDAQSVVMQALQWARSDSIDVTQELDVRQEATRVMAILQSATHGWRPGSLWRPASQDGYAGWGYPLDNILYLFRDLVQKNLASSLDSIAQIPRPGGPEPKAKWTLSILPNGSWALAIGYDATNGSVIHAHMVPHIDARVVGAGYIWFDEEGVLLLDGDSKGLPTTIDTCSCLDIMGFEISDEPGLMIAGQFIADHLDYPVFLALNPFQLEKPKQKQEAAASHESAKTAFPHQNGTRNKIGLTANHYDIDVPHGPQVSANLALKPQAKNSPSPNLLPKRERERGITVVPQRRSHTRKPANQVRAIHNFSSAHNNFVARPRSPFRQSHSRGLWK